MWEDETVPSDLNETIAAQRPALLAYIRGIVRNKQVAEDLTQETMLRAHQGISGLKDPDRLIPWLYRIATNSCRDYFRKEKRADKAFQGSGDSVSPDELRDENAPQLDKLIECAEMSECVSRYFGMLPNPYRAVIILHDLEGLTNPEIAGLLGVSLHTAKVRLHRARNKLREMLVDVCEFYIDERGILVCERKHAEH